ncbi:DNA-binding response regulator [Amycolatopsis sp. A1MSW2902]|uniref:response regulator n=1 Tax=unclassified Amycolatopsis TaxID=2618356 RepID=UPI00106DEAAC|nr:MULTISPECIES: response regulator transcription factor [unclassified Amycolatopsis]
MAVTVVIADDQTMVRQSFRAVLAAQPDIEVVGEAATGTEAVAACRALRPDLVLMDIRMPDLDGLAATRLILGDGEDARPRVLVLTTFDADEYVYGALSAGASGFLLKDSPLDDLVVAVRMVAAGNALFAPAVTRRVIEGFAGTRRPTQDVGRLSELTARELEVLRLIARGLSNADIAAQLVIAEQTAKTHVSRVLGKLGVRDRAQAVVMAYEAKFVVPGQ